MTPCLSLSRWIPRFIVKSAVLGLMIVLAVSLAACGGTTVSPSSSSPVTLTFWTWVPNIQSEVNLFEQSHPNIKIKVVNAGQGAPEYTKLRTALKAGSGGPDIVQIEFQYLPTQVGINRGNRSLHLVWYHLSRLNCLQFNAARLHLASGQK